MSLRPASYHRSLCWVLVLLLASCVPSDLEPSELAGHWQLFAESRDDLDAPFQDLRPRLTLQEDGTFVAEELPGEMLYLSEPWRSGAVSGSGRWKIENREYGKVDAVLTFQRLDSGDQSRLPYGTYLRIYRGSEGYDLFYFSGDPDEFRRIFFQRISAPGG